VNRSRTEFESYVKMAETELNRSKELDEKGEPVGERSLLLLPKNPKIPSAPDNQSHYVLVWTRGPVFCKISGERKEDVMALEKRIRRNSNRAIAWPDLIE